MGERDGAQQHRCESSGRVRGGCEQEWSHHSAALIPSVPLLECVGERARKARRSEFASPTARGEGSSRGGGGRWNISEGSFVRDADERERCAPLVAMRRAVDDMVAGSAGSVPDRRLSHAWRSSACGHSPARAVPVGGNAGLKAQGSDSERNRVAVRRVAAYGWRRCPARERQHEGVEDATALRV